MLTYEFSDTLSVDAIGQRWRRFEAEAGCSFFQSWAWVGCLAAERFDAPLLLEARRGDATVAMSLFNRRRRWWSMAPRLYLGESGRPSLDAVFVEHNGFLLVRPGAHEFEGAELLRGCLNAALGRGGALTLSGVNAAHLQAAEECQGVVRARQLRLAPHADLAAVRRSGAGYLEGLSANTRQQLRRSARAFGAKGPLQVRRAETAKLAHDFLDCLGVLHQQTWTRRGRAGAFANPDFVRFHHALIDGAHETGGVDLLRITAGESVLGYLYNLRRGGRVSAYQSGFDYAQASSHHRPGLTCHHLAIEHYLEAGADAYDFLGGADRYKLSLSNDGEPLWWLDLVRAGSLPGIASTLRARLTPAS